MSYKLGSATASSSSADYLVATALSVETSTGNDATSFSVACPEPVAGPSWYRSAANAPSAEVVKIEGRVHENIMLSQPIYAVQDQEADGYSIYEALLDIVEFAERPSEAVRNLIDYLVSESLFLLNAPDGELASDAQDQKRRYQKIVDVL